jgi:hypothetical protein
MFIATQAIGDLFPSMLIRLFLRTLQYAVATDADKNEWQSEDGLMVFGELMTELGSPLESLQVTFPAPRPMLCFANSGARGSISVLV